MMNILKSKKVILVVVIIILIIGFVVWSRSSTPTFEEDLLILPEGGIIGEELGTVSQSADFFLSQINQLQGISFEDINLLTSPAFTNLQDNTVELPEFPVGRSNPFAPIGAGDDFLFPETDDEGTSEASQ